MIRFTVGIIVLILFSGCVRSVREYDASYPKSNSLVVPLRAKKTSFSAEEILRKTDVEVKEVFNDLAASTSSINSSGSTTRQDRHKVIISELKSKKSEVENER